MSQLDQIRGQGRPGISFSMHLRALLPAWLDGMPLYRQVQAAGLCTDPRDLLEYFYLELLRLKARGDTRSLMEELASAIRQLRWQMRNQGWPDGSTHFRPGVQAVLEAEFGRTFDVLHDELSRRSDADQG